MKWRQRNDEKKHFELKSMLMSIFNELKVLIFLDVLKNNLPTVGQTPSGNVIGQIVFPLNKIEISDSLLVLPFLVVEDVFFRRNFINCYRLLCIRGNN